MLPNAPSERASYKSQTHTTSRFLSRLRSRRDETRSDASEEHSDVSKAAKNAFLDSHKTSGGREVVYNRHYARLRNGV